MKLYTIWSGCLTMLLLYGCTPYSPPSTNEIDRALRENRTEILRRFVESGDVVTHMRLVPVLAETRTPTAQDSLRVLANDGEELVQRAIIYNCSKMPQDEALALLEILMTSNNSGIRSEAVEKWREISDKKL